MKLLQIDSEKQLIEFDQIIPYRYNNSNKIFSPRLVNLALSVSPQIESLVKLIIKETSIETESKAGIRDKIRSINSKGVLSSFQIISRMDKNLLQPFDPDLSWWKLYNNTKHEIFSSQFEIGYKDVLLILAALAGLHRVSDVLGKFEKEHHKEILDKQYWMDKQFHNMDSSYISERGMMVDGPRLWQSALFEIPTYYTYE